MVDITKNSFFNSGTMLNTGVLSGVKGYYFNRSLPLVKSSSSTGWTGKFNGVSSSNISKINGIAIANIAKVNGV